MDSFIFLPLLVLKENFPLMKFKMTLFIQLAFPPNSLKLEESTLKWSLRYSKTLFDVKCGVEDFGLLFYVSQPMIWVIWAVCPNYPIALNTLSTTLSGIAKNFRNI